jgi:hypothetical protein
VAQPRSRKRGQRQRPATRPRPALPDLGAGDPKLSRSQQRDAAARAALEPLAPGERPWPIIASAAVATLLGLSNLILFLVGAKPKVSGQHAQAPEILVFTALMLLCAYGMWRLRYWAVLGFQTLLAIGLLGFSLALIKVESIFWAFVCLVIIGITGTLFWKLVRILGRIQMPIPPQRRS